MFQQAALWAAASAAVVEEKQQRAVFCEQVSVGQFEAQKLSASQLALAELLEGIINNHKMSEKDKKRRLKQVGNDTQERSSQYSFFVIPRPF
jgi:hypothetical protein